MRQRYLMSLAVLAAVHKAGDRWNARSPQGEEEVLTIVAGQK